MSSGVQAFPVPPWRDPGVPFADLFQLDLPPPPERLTPPVLRDAIARACMPVRQPGWDPADSGALPEASGSWTGRAGQHGFIPGAGRLPVDSQTI